MKRAFAIILALALVVSLSVFAFAGTYSITIDNAVEGESYTAYKIFDVSYANPVSPAPTQDASTAPDSTHLNSAYAYTISSNGEWFDFFTTGLTADANGVYTNSTYGLKFTPTSTDPTTYVVEVLATNGFDSTKAAALAADINAAIKTAAAGTYTAAGTATTAANETSVTIDVSPDVAGYYFVSTSLGSLCSLDTTEPAAHIFQKNTTSSVTKAVEEDETATFGDKNDAAYGETVYFKTEAVIGAHQKNVKLYDVMYNGLKLCPAANITVSLVTDATTTPVTTAALPAANYTLTRVDDTHFNIEFATAWTEGLTADTTVIVEYSAEVLTTAVLDVPATTTLSNGNDNETWLTYGADQETTHDWTRTYVWSFPIFKYTGAAGSETPLADAHFSLYTPEIPAAGGNPAVPEAIIQFVTVSTGDATNPTVYRLATAAEISDNTVTKVTDLVTPASGLITIQGVDGDPFVLKETAAPAGYNKLADDVAVEITAIESAADQGNSGDGTYAPTVTKVLLKDNSSTSQVGILNNTGAELPSTGGIGTTIFYVVGGLLAVAAVVLLITKKRASKE